MSINGRLSLEAFSHNWIVNLGVLSMVGAVLAVAILLTYKKRWGWLYREWLTSTDPKKIGVMYIVVAILMLLRGFGDAVMMKAQQALGVGGGGFLDADHFQQVFTAHGTIMIFFVAMGLMFGLFNLIVPLQIGARDVAFPFLNATSFWLYLAGAALMNVSLGIGDFAAAGWLAYPPLSETTYSPGVGVDYWIWSLQIAGIGSLMSGINFFVTIIKCRVKGMDLMKMPLFCWSVLGSTILILFAFPILTVSLTLLALDRSLGMHFFASSFGGNPMMYINLIWAWGHPEVYILILPAFGIFSEIVSTFSSKRLFGYKSMVWALVSITFLSYVVWAHHFFTMGAGGNVNAFFGIMTMIIAIPTGVKVFNWLFTMYRGRIRFTTPMLWFFGFIATFTIGGATGVLLAVPPADFQLHNSLFLVAHFHNMVIGGVVFGYFAGLSYWFPKIFGFKLNERLGRYGFYCWLVGFLMTFIPIYILGLMGATRRLDHYDASLGWQELFIVSGIGVAIIGAGVMFQVLQLFVSIRDRAKNRDTTGDPWDGRTLEWATSSPAPVYNFAILPEVTTRDAFWEIKLQKDNNKNPIYKTIHLPKNTPLPILLSGSAFTAGFGIIWHIYWLALLGLAGVVATIIWRSFDDETEYSLSPSMIKEIEQGSRRL